MELLQNILMVLTVLAAVCYLIQKFIWKPSFLKPGVKKTGCGESDCGCG